MKDVKASYITIHHLQTAYVSRWRDMKHMLACGLHSYVMEQRLGKKSMPLN